MNEEKKETKQPDKKISNKKKLCYSIAALLVVVALIAGLSYAWFYNQTDMATLMAIKPPSTISIRGPGGSEMTSLDLNYSDGDKDADNKVTVRRVICVQSEESVTGYKLEIVHTTNLKGLTFSLYPVSEAGNATVTDSDEKGTSYTYKYNSSEESKLSGNYLNLQKSSDSGYKYANGDKHQKNYGDYTNVQAHAEPLYWLAKDTLKPNGDTANQVTIDDTTYNRTYYVCEVSWTEITKETDIFYILVKTA
ncbi:hypothetical protein [Blautia sp. MSJ-19]|uniref:hypothetical protein n=1 Tax=Blautia sp. MSJ-19 TaxID=2841517 RepID=UPI001C0F36A1|nr:hypothetical protein [Blautia sp. MSJ-19]MBU5480533.1 hypothetical protein [Blautia sp. MSJ-19]